MVNRFLSKDAADSANADDPPLPATIDRPPPTPSTAFSSQPHAKRVASRFSREPAWHTLEKEQVLDALGCCCNTGLSHQAVAKALSKYGSNSLPTSKPRSSWAMFLGQFQSLPVLLLMGAAALSTVTGGIADAAVILGVILINAGIGFVTESQTERTLLSLIKTTQRQALVLREGQVQEIAAENLVPGDILMLVPGARVAADARLLETRHLCVDESPLTGESLPVIKSPARLAEPEAPLADRLNMVHMGTMVTGGSGLGVVVATGARSQIGAIQSLVNTTRPPETPMERQLDHLGTQMVWLSIAICGVVFLVGLLRGYGLLQMLASSVALAVAAVPEGLPTVATTTLALGVRRMRRHQVLIRQLDAVETLGAVQVICLDKTGTLTMNRMRVLTLHAGSARIHVTEEDLWYRGVPLNPFSHDELLRLMHVAVLCNETQIDGTRDAYVLNGSPTESALVQLALACGIDVPALRGQYPMGNVEYRTEGRSYMSTLHAPENGSALLAVKGSPAEVLALCRWRLAAGSRYELTDQDRASILAENESMASDGLRVLGFAYDQVEQGGTPAGDELTWLGLAGLADPVRHGVAELIELFHQAGIKTVMITGDQSATAYAIGKELALSDKRPLEIMDSAHLDRLEPELLAKLVEQVDIFARVSPGNKLQIVQGLQQAGKVVAMTGDGINDGPALRAADIGIAMGNSGTDTARAVSDVVIEDDELRTMIVAVSEGRTIYNNIRKSVHFLMSTNASEILTMLISLAAGQGQPLSTMQLLWINLLTDVFPALALAVEPPEPDVLRVPPRDPQEAIIRPSDLGRYGRESLTITAGALAGYGYGLARYGPGAQAGTLAFMTLAMGQLFHTWSCRSETHGLFSHERLPRNPYLNWALGTSVGLQILAVTVPGLRSLLGTTSITALDAGVILGGASLPFLINEAAKGSGKRALPAPPQRTQPVIAAAIGGKPS